MTTVSLTPHSDPTGLGTWNCGLPTGLWISETHKQQTILYIHSIVISYFA